ncbi:MAG: SRPBCC family protein [Nitriliruptoraceae bacterium]
MRGDRRHPAHTLVLAASAASAAVVATRATRHLGAVPAEVAARLPGDDLVPPGAHVTTRAVAIPAPASEVWPWLVQMGYGRGGWYAIDALERAIGVGTPSARQVRPELQGLAVGDRVPLSDRVDLVVDHIEPDRSLVLTLPEGPLAWVWSFRLAPTATGCRLVVRTAIGARRGGVRGLVPLLDAGHTVMEFVQLHTIRRRVVAARRAG